MDQFLSPIARKSAKAAYERHASGGEVKGTGRRRTQYRRPPMAKIIEMCGSVQALGRMRGMLANAAYEGRMNPSQKTESEWERVFWTRVIALLVQNPIFVYNHTLRWAKPPHIRQAIEYTFEAIVKSLPSPAERLKARGIIIEGVT